MNNKNIISPRGRDFFLCRRKKRYAELMGIDNHKNIRIKNLVDNNLIGRFSCLSVSKLANITSFYNGKAYYYVMNMDIDQLHIDKIYELDTTEPNGVEVKIPLESFNADDLQCLSFIENIYVECDGDERNSGQINYFNKRKVYTFNNFKVLDSIIADSYRTEILLGKIPYTVNYIDLWNYNDYWHRSWEDAMQKIYPCINIGDVDVTPNREALIYSERTKECLRSIYDKCISELTELWNKECNKVYSDFGKWALEIISYRKNKLILEGVGIPISNELPFNVKYANHPEWDSVSPQDKKNWVNNLMSHRLDTLGTLTGGTLYRGRRDLHINFRDLIERWVQDTFNRGRMLLVVPSQMGFSSKYFKDFLTNKYNSKEIIFLRKKYFSVDNLKHIIKDLYGVTMLTDTTNLSFIVSLLKEAYRYIASNSTYDDVMSSTEYQKYKKEHQDPRNSVIKRTSKIVFTIACCNSNVMDKYTFTIDELLEWLKKNHRKERVVYSTLDSPFLSTFFQISYPNLIIISAAKNNMKYLEGGLPEYIRPIEELYTPDNRVLIKYKTAEYIRSLDNITLRTEDFMSYNVKVGINKLNNYLSLYNINKTKDYYINDNSHILDIIPEGVYDYYMIGVLNSVMPYLKLSYKLRNICVNTIQCYLLMKAKKLRPSYSYYKEMREYVDSIINAL